MKSIGTFGPFIHYVDFFCSREWKASWTKSPNTRTPRSGVNCKVESERSMWCIVWSCSVVQTPLAARKKTNAPVSFVVVPVPQRRRRGIVVAFTLCFLIMMVLIVAVSGVCLYRFLVHKVSGCWQTRATRLEVGQGHQTWYHSICQVWFPISVQFCPLRRTVFEIFNFKNAMTLKTELGVCQGHWKCQHLIERIWVPIDVL